MQDKVAINISNHLRVPFLKAVQLRTSTLFLSTLDGAAIEVGGSSLQETNRLYCTMT